VFPAEITQQPADYLQEATTTRYPSYNAFQTAWLRAR
jgi:hypothetical protein